MIFDKATIKCVQGGYILNVRWPFAGLPMAGGEAVRDTFDDAMTLLYQHLFEDHKIDRRYYVRFDEQPQPDIAKNRLLGLTARVRRVSGGYIVERLKYFALDEVVFITFEEAMITVYKHLHKHAVDQKITVGWF